MCCIIINKSDSKSPLATSCLRTPTWLCIVVPPWVWARGRTPKTNILGVIFHPYGEKNPLSDRHKILHWVRCPGRNHRCKFGGWSVKPYFRGEGSNFSLFHRLSQSSTRPYNALALPCECVMVYTRTVTHPSTNRARRWATTLIETNALPLSQTATFGVTNKWIACFFSVTIHFGTTSY